MCYKVKTSLMKKVISKRQKNNPFDFEKSENFKLSSDSDLEINNSYYFSAHNPETNESLFCRLGERTSGNEVWFYYSDGKRRLNLKTMLFDSDTPLTIYKKDDLWFVEFNGQLVEENKTLNCSFEGKFISKEKIIDFFTTMPPIRMAKAMAFEKWNKKFFEEIQANNQVHYEQFGILEGTLKVEDEVININMPCVRDHSYGMRDWNYMNNHLWLMALNKERQLNFSMVSYPAMTLLECGNFNDLNKDTTFVLEAYYDRKSIVKNFAPKSFDVSLKMNDGTIKKVKMTLEDEVEYLFKDGAYRFIEGVASYEIDGEKYRGIFELGFNKDEKRFYNGKAVSKLKI